MCGLVGKWLLLVAAFEGNAATPLLAIELKRNPTQIGMSLNITPPCITVTLVLKHRHAVPFIWPLVSCWRYLGAVYPVYSHCTISSASCLSPGLAQSSRSCPSPALCSYYYTVLSLPIHAVSPVACCSSCPGKIASPILIMVPAQNWWLLGRISASPLQSVMFLAHASVSSHTCS